MAWIYNMELRIIFQTIPKNIKEYAKELLDKSYAIVNKIKISQKEDILIINYIFTAGAPITRHEALLSRYLNPEEIKDFDLRELSMQHEKSPDYFQYLAKKRFNNEKPLSLEEFNKEIEKGQYWEDI